jgi:hypothetical protein
MKFFGLLASTVALAGLLSGFVGCEAKPAPKTGDSSAEHGHGEEGHDHGDGKEKSNDPPPVALKNVYDKTVAAAQKIRDALEKGEIDSAHDELHDIGHYLNDLPGLAKAAAMDPAKVETLEKASKTLFDVMGKIDESLHDSKEVKFDDVKESLEGGLAELKGLGEALPK